MTAEDDILTTMLSARPLRAYIAWKRYQRRAEVLAPVLGCSGVCYFPHSFKSKALRPFDYLLELVRTTIYLARLRPRLVFLQAPPLFSAIGAILSGTPYIIDVHNTLVQSFWSRIPLTNVLIRRAQVLIAHNSEIADVIRTTFPAATVVIVQDPLEDINNGRQPRNKHDILIICSFDRDEPIALLLSMIQELPEFTFTITADPARLPRGLHQSFEECANLRLTGFLDTESYHSLLSSCQAAVVLCTMPAVQPSGAVEALASNTPLIVTRSSLTESLFGEWAHLVDNNLESLTNAIRFLTDDKKDLHVYRARWNDTVYREVQELESYLTTHSGTDRKG